MKNVVAVIVLLGSMVAFALQSGASNLQLRLAKPSTVFPDGWTSTLEPGRVRVSRSNGATVRLHYGIRFPAEMFVYGNETARLDYYFDRVATTRYTIESFGLFQNKDCQPCWYYGDGVAIEKSSGRKIYLGFMVDFRDGFGYAIELTAPNLELYNQAFPNLEAIQKMQAYNRFQVTLNDLVGTWEQGSGSTQALYNTYTGAYAGSSVVRGDHTFTFNKNGTYKSKHNLVTGTTNALNATVLEYAGNVSFNNWRMTMTRRFEGKPETYDAIFEATAGGLVLRMTLAGKALQYALVKRR